MVAVQLRFRTVSMDKETRLGFEKIENEHIVRMGLDILLWASNFQNLPTFPVTPALALAMLRPTPYALFKKGRKHFTLR